MLSISPVNYFAFLSCICCLEKVVFGAKDSWTSTILWCCPLAPPCWCYLTDGGGGRQWIKKLQEIGRRWQRRGVVSRSTEKSNFGLCWKCQQNQRKRDPVSDYGFPLTKVQMAKFPKMSHQRTYCMVKSSCIQHCLSFIWQKKNVYSASECVQTRNVQKADADCSFCILLLGQ